MYELPPMLLVANPLHRYLINSPMLPQLKRDADGGLTPRPQGRVSTRDCIASDDPPTQKQRGSARSLSISAVESPTLAHNQHAFDSCFAPMSAPNRRYSAECH
jgi:hypothetical protein